MGGQALNQAMPQGMPNFPAMPQGVPNFSQYGNQFAPLAQLFANMPGRVNPNPPPVIPPAPGMGRVPTPVQPPPLSMMQQPTGVMPTQNQQPVLPIAPGYRSY